MFSNANYRAKMVRALAQALDGEAAHLRKYYWLGKGAAFSGGILVGIALFASFQGGRPSVVWLVAAGTLGGLLIGLSIYFNSSVKQWPVLKRFINVQAVQEAVRQDEL